MVGGEGGETEAVMSVDYEVLGGEGGETEAVMSDD